VGSDSKNGVRHQRALSPRLSMMMMMWHIFDVRADVDVKLFVIRGAGLVKLLAM